MKLKNIVPVIATGLISTLAAVGCSSKYDDLSSFRGELESPEGETVQATLERQSEAQDYDLGQWHHYNLERLEIVGEHNRDWVFYADEGTWKLRSIYRYSPEESYIIQRSDGDFWKNIGDNDHVMRIYQTSFEHYLSQIAQLQGSD